tara:strand:+ start:107 stop:610 length:504 start_codon:yes stop_codon:yes gene_type:complete
MVSLSKNGGMITFKNDDEYNTPKEAWDAIVHLIPKDKTLWEAFMMGNTSSKSMDYLIELGCEVVGSPELDFFENDLGDVIVSNPPYSCKKKIFKRLAELDKPFILILPISTISKQFVKCLKREFIQMIIPSKRIQFIKGGDALKRCWFDTCYLCYKMNLEKDITFIN